MKEKKKEMKHEKKESYEMEMKEHKKKPASRKKERITAYDKEMDRKNIEKARKYKGK